MAEEEGVESLSLLLTRQASVQEATLGPDGSLAFEASVLRRRAHPFRKWWPTPESHRARRVFSATLVTM